MTMCDKAQELLRNMKSTAAARYNASKRLEGRERSLIRLTGFTSAYLIGLTVLPYFIDLPVGAADRMNLLTFALGVIILVASLIQYSARDGINAEQHYRCGLEISEMRRRLKITAKAATDEELLEIGDAYALILQKYSINHDQVDFDQYRMERKEEARKFNFIERTAISLRIGIVRHLASIMLLTVSLLLAWLIFAIIAPAWQLSAVAPV